MSCPHLRRVVALSGHVAPAKASAVPALAPRQPGGGTGALPAINGAALRKVGDESMFINEAGEPDFPSGLVKMAANVPADVGLGYYTSYRMDGDGNMKEKQVVLCTRPEFIAEIMSNEVEHYLWGGIEPASVAFFGARVLFVLEGKEWSDLRKTMRPVLLPANLPLVATDVIDAAHKLADTLMQRAERQEMVDLHLAHQCYHLQAVSKALYNTEIPALVNFPTKHTVHQSFNDMLDELGRRAFHDDISVQFDYTTPNEDNQMWKENRDVIHDSVLASLRPRLSGEQRCPVGGDGDFLQQLIAAHKEDHPGMGQHETEQYLGANLVELLFAGYNTVVNTMSAAIYLLANHPEKMQNARDHVEGILGGRLTPTFDDLEKMTYLEDIMYETLRLYSPTPAIGRKLSQDTQLGAVLVPAGSDIMIPMCAVHRDPTYWESPEKFMPERFEGKPIESLFSKKTIARGSWMPFSDGPRRCLGQHYARMVFKAALVQHLLNFDYEPAPRHRFKTSFNGFGSQVWDDLSSSPSLPIIIKKRSR